MSKIVSWLILIVPLLTLFFLNKKQLKHYMPVGILSSFLMALYNIVAYNDNHWIIKVNIISWLEPLFTPGIFGIFFVITIWVFYFTYTRLWIYLITNIVIDFMFAFFPIHYILQNKLDIYELINITPWGRFLIFVSFSIVIYCYQKWLEEVFIPT